MDRPHGFARPQLYGPVVGRHFPGDTAFEPRQRFATATTSASDEAVIMLRQCYDIRVIHATTGEIIRTLTIDPRNRCSGTGRPPGGAEGPRKTKRSGP